MSKVQLVEMGLRDGLQNESAVLSTEDRVEFARRLADAGSQKLEIGAFVSPRWVPQMAGTADIVRGVQALQKSKKISPKVGLSVLVPNERGMNDAMAAGMKEIAVFAACSESFSLKNTNCSIEESFERFEPVFKLAKKNKILVRAYLSTCFGCPFEGDVPESQVVKLARRLAEMGSYEISIGDTIGVADPGQVESVMKKVMKHLPAKKLAGHFHDTRGQALANILASFKLGIRTFDTSLGGLGGCPYAPGATGNVATEDVAYMFHGMGVQTGVDLEKMIAINAWMAGKIGHALPSKVGKAGVLKPLGKIQKASGNSTAKSVPK